MRTWFGAYNAGIYKEVMKNYICISMRRRAVHIIPVLALSFIFNMHHQPAGWRSFRYKKYTYYSNDSGETDRREYAMLIKKGIKETEVFFGGKFRNKFDVYVHPGRASIDSTWRHDWKMPSFKSECWMVASGVAARLDMIAPKAWEQFACEHRYSDAVKTQQLITHELVHVYHGQQNNSPDFSDAEHIDWFVEGLATYASGQLDTARISEIRKLIADKKAPQTLDKFWTGRLRYGLSGSVVKYIDAAYGRKKLIELLPFNKKTEILSVLKITEAELLKGWEGYMGRL